MGHSPPAGGMAPGDVGLLFFAPLLMFAVVIISGAGWVCAFLPVSFFETPAGALWMRTVGTTNVATVRFISCLLGLLGIGACVGLIACIATGHVERFLPPLRSLPAGATSCRAGIISC